METKNKNKPDNKLSNFPLYQSLLDFEFDDPHAAAPFSVRLAAELGWTMRFTREVIDEYRRFIYLTQVAGHPVTPSEEVDHVWHFHLAYTRSYWDGLCAGVLGKPLHHDPTGGGGDEAAKYKEWYERTLEVYEREFGEAPSQRVWPAAAVRFSQPLQRMTNTLHHLAVPRPPNAIFAITIVTLFLMIMMTARVPQPHRFIEVAGSLALVLLAWCLFALWNAKPLYDGIVRKTPNRNDSGGGCSTGCGGCS